MICLGILISKSGESLYVNGHILDRIDFVTPVGDDLESIIARLYNFFRQRGIGLLDAYLNAIPETQRLAKSSFARSIEHQRFQNLDNVSEFLLSAFGTVSRVARDVLSELISPSPCFH